MPFSYRPRPVTIIWSCVCPTQPREHPTFCEPASACGAHGLPLPRTSLLTIPTPLISPLLFASSKHSNTTERQKRATFVLAARTTSGNSSAVTERFELLHISPSSCNTCCPCRRGRSLNSRRLPPKTTKLSAPFNNFAIILVVVANSPHLPAPGVIESITLSSSIADKITSL
jgi:hypothetical protein